MGSDYAPLDDLYREVILEHYRDPRGREPVAEAQHHGEGVNPLCGDEVIIDVRTDEGRITGVHVASRGCSISVAAGSILAQEMEGRTEEEARALVQVMRNMMQGQPPGDGAGDLGDLEVLAGVQKFPVRIKCALLPWLTFENALDDRPGAVNTEEGDPPP